MSPPSGRDALDRFGRPPSRTHRALVRTRRRRRFVLLVSAATLYVPMLASSIASQLIPRPTPPAAARSAEVIQPEDTMVEMHDGRIWVDGRDVESYGDPTRVRRLDGLFHALRERGQHPGSTRRMRLRPDPAASAIAVKSVFQTAAFAGFRTALLVDGVDGGVDIAAPP